MTTEIARQSAETESASFSIETIVRENQARLYALAYRYAGNQQDALDIVQESVYKALRGAKQLREEDHALGWLLKIVGNTALDFLRRRRRIETTDLDALYDVGAEDDLSDMEVEEALHRLAPQDRAIVHLRAIEGMKLNDIAEVTGMNVNTIKSRLYKAIAQLRIDLKEEEE